MEPEIPPETPIIIGGVGIKADYLNKDLGL